MSSFILEFKEDPEIESTRTSYIQEADELFKQIQESIKKSEHHLKLLSKFNQLNARTNDFLQRHKYYFGAKRRYYLTKGNISRKQVLPLNAEERELANAN